MASDIRSYILQQYPSCVTFARDVLGWPVHKSGDRTVSLNPGPHRKPNLQIWDNYWVDYKDSQTLRGSVIDLCAWAKFGGDIGRAMKFLAGDFYSVKSQEWEQKVRRITQDTQSWHKNLRKCDRDYLHSRRITDECIERHQIGFTETDEWGKCDPRLVIPYFKNGRIVYWIGRAATYDRTDYKQKYGLTPAELLTRMNRKYRKMKSDEENGVFCPLWGLHTLGADYYEHRRGETVITSSGDTSLKDDWLVVCEGAFDALSFSQEWWAVLAAMGTNFSRWQLRDLCGEARHFKHVLVIFDNDTAGWSHQVAVMEQLFAHRIDFWCGYVPKKFGETECKDVSDYYTAGGRLEDLVAEAVPGIPVLAESYTDQAKFKQFFMEFGKYADKPSVIELCERLRGKFPPFWFKAVIEAALKAPTEINTVERVMQKHNLLYADGLGFFEYTHGVWRRTSDNEVKNMAADTLGGFATNARMTGAAQHLKAKCITTQPFNTQSILNLQNGVLLIDDKDCRFVEHSPSFMSSIQIPVHYDREAQCPVFMKFIDTVMQNDEEKIFLLQEIAGYPMFPNNELERAFFLKGAGGNGKGVFIDTLMQVYGEENCSTVDPSKFGSDFEPIMLQSSLINLCTESQVNMRSAEARFKAIVSGDPINAAHKGVDAVKFRPRAKLITSCNDFINSQDVSHGFLRRLVFIEFNVNFDMPGIFGALKQKDTKLREKLREELPGILNWCIEGYRRLRINGSFTQTAESERIMQEFMDSANPLVSFINEKLMDLYDAKYDIHELFGRYREWCKSTEVKPLEQNQFTRQLRTLMKSMRPEVEIYRGGGNVYQILFPAEKYIAGI